MPHTSRRNRRAYAFADEDTSSALARDAEAILALVDTAEAAWPSIAAALQEFKAAGIELNETSVALAIKLGRQRWAELGVPELPAFEQPTLVTATSSIVYYVRRGAVIKIGTTIRPRERFADLMPDEILAFEPGGTLLESARHRQFKHLRMRGEHFRDEPELRDHISQVRKVYGEPDQSWPTMGSRDGRWQGWHPQRPASSQTLTAPEAVEELGIKWTTIRQWVHKGRIQSVGVGEDKLQRYLRDQLIELRDSARARLVSRL